MTSLTYLDIGILEFKTKEDWDKWLENNHQSFTGVWLRFYKKASEIPTVLYQEAVDIALCYGWIDSQVKSYDDKSYLQKFTPRKSKSPWSKINVEKAEQFIKEGKMKPAGLLAIDEAKKNGNWLNAYSSPTKMEVPNYFLKELAKNKKAKDFFESLSKTEKFYFLYSIQNAKRPETREKRIKEAINLLEKGQKKN